jgi:hypothetical protein
MSSKYEGLPMVLVEAQSFGLLLCLMIVLLDQVMLFKIIKTACWLKTKILRHWQMRFYNLLPLLNMLAEFSQNSLVNAKKISA